MDYFTADLHLGHRAALKFGRPFETPEDMNETLIENWNKRVRERDTVYICGDLFFRCEQTEIVSILNRLRGGKVLVLGNHDYCWYKEKLHGAFFRSVTQMVELKRENRRMTLCHYPLLEWPADRYGSWLIYGHIHGTREGLTFETIRRLPRALNAGVDVNDYRPVTFDELVENNARFYGEREKEGV